MTDIFDRIGLAVSETTGPYGTWHKSNYAGHRRRYESDLQCIKEIRAGGEILELGCAPCHLTAALKLSGYDVVGIDLDPSRAQFIIDCFGLDVRQCDIERQPLPFDDGRFDCVVFAEVFEHLRIDPLFTLSEINRVMRVGGRLLFTTPNLYSAQNIARFLLGRGLRDPVSAFMQLRTVGHMGHIREYSTTEIQRFLSMSNFTVRRLKYEHYHYPRSLKGAVGRVAFKILPPRFRTFQVLMVEKTGPPASLTPLT